MSNFNESKVNRQSAGTSAGGQFANKDHPANDGVGLGDVGPEDDWAQHEPRRYSSRKIDKREARKRWNRGLGVAVAADRTFFNESLPLPSSNYVTRADMVGHYGKEAADFDHMVSLSSSRGGAISFAAPELEEDHQLVKREPIPVEEIRAGDRIDVGAVGNWKVRGQTQGEGGEMLFRMDGTLGGDDGPTLRVREESGNYVGELLDPEGSPYSDVSYSITSGAITRNTPESDATAVREKIARNFPNAVFTEPMVVDSSFEKLSEHIETYDCAPGGYGFVDGNIVKFNNFDDPRRLEAVAVWEPNTTFSSMVRRR